MNKNVVVFYSRLPLSDMQGKTRIGKELKNQKIASQLARAMINDMLAEYNPFLEDEYDFVYFYAGDIKKFRTRYKYNIRRFIFDRSKGDVRTGMMSVHGMMAHDYENIIIVGSDIPMITKSMIKDGFRNLEKNDVVLAPVVDGGYGMVGSTGFIDLYSAIRNFDSRSEGYDLYNQTVKLLDEKGLDHSSTQVLRDIDSLADVQNLYNSITQNGDLRPEYLYLTKTFSVLNKYKKEFSL